MNMILLAMFLPLLVSVRGECGIPGLPKNGEVQVRRNATHAAAFYSCAKTFSIEGDKTRTCNDGKWSGSIPRCGVKLNISHAVEPQRTSICKSVKNGTLTIPFNQSLFVENVIIQLHNPSKDAVYVTYLTLAGNNPSAPKSLDSFCEVTSTPDLTLTCNINESGTGIQLIMNGTVDPALTICNLTINTFPDGCGKPDEPVNGAVFWTEREATYHCNEEYKLSTTSSKTRCVASRWTGEQPKCLSTSNPFHLNSLSLNLGIIFGILITSGSILILYLFSCTKKKISEFISRKRTGDKIVYEDAANGSAEVEHTYEEIRDRDSVNVAPSIAMEELNAAPIRPVPDGFQGYEIPNHLID